ncbi:DNA ligase [Pseudohyphozyma bogoriensis]|nr:DNA ligase [Pseudohyphozyma bogoriensis]
MAPKSPRKGPSTQYKEPAADQGQLSAFLGQPQKARPQTLNALFKKQRQPRAHDDDDNDVIVMAAEPQVQAEVKDEEMEDVEEAGDAKKRKAADGDDSEVKAKDGEGSAKKLKSMSISLVLQAVDNSEGADSRDGTTSEAGNDDDKPQLSLADQLFSPTKEKKPVSPKKEVKPEEKKEDEEKPKVASTSSITKKADDKPKPSSFFAPRSAKGKEKQEEPEPEEENKSEAEEDDEEDESEEEEEEGATTKLAELFTKKTASSANTATWAAGAPVPYSALTATFDAIGKTTKRLEISALLTSFLIEVIEKTPGDLLKTVYLCINRLCPDYEPLELGIGESLLMKAIGESCGRTLAQVKADYKKVGDLGEVAMASRKKQATLFAPKRLTIDYTFGILTQIAKASGHKSQERKVGLINKLLAACLGTETKFLIRSLEGKLRIGLAERTVLVSLAHAVVKAEKNKEGKKLSSEKLSKALEEGSDILKQVFSELPSYDLVIPALLEHGIYNLKEHCFLTPGIPLKPMLAKPTKAITEVLDRFEGKKFTCEYKYDGERAQVHYLEDGSIKVFSRNSEDMSAKYPDLVVQIPKVIKEGTKSFVIDAEAVAWDKDEKRLLPFQELTRRKRKDVKAEDIVVKVHLFAFDLLFLNGKPLLEENLERRRELLREHLQPVEGEFAFATSEDATIVEDIQIFLDKSVKEGCEGLMVKMLEGEGSSYEPSRRSIHWLKLKKDYLAGVGDSFDLVVIGGDYGRGKRTNVYGAFHLAIWDPEEEEYQLICKIGTGFSEADLQSHYDFLHPLELAGKKGYFNIGTSKGPDVYFEPKMVWEVLAADLSLSPIYPAGKRACQEEGISEDRGISLRFPRFIRIRDDKGPEDSTDGDQVAAAYQRQAVAAPGKKGKRGKGDAVDDGFW